MRTLFKKSLAFCLVASLALTCFIGSFSVSAATYSASITVADTTIIQGNTTADIIIQISSPDVGINEARLQVSSSVGTISTKVSLVKDASGTSYTPEELETLDFEVAHDVADDGVTISDYNSFWLSGKTYTTAITSAFIKVTFNVSPSKKAAPYPVSIYAPSEDIKVIASSPNEDIISFDTSNVGNVVVVHTTHTFVYTPNEGDTHTYDCSSCENFDPVTEDCTFENGACIKCKDPQEVVEEETFTVTFVDSDGTTVLKTEEVAPNGAATAPEVASDPDNNTYFTGWDKDFSAIAEDTTVTAQYKELAIRTMRQSTVFGSTIDLKFYIGATKGKITDSDIVELGILVWDDSNYNADDISYNQAYAFPVVDREDLNSSSWNYVKVTRYAQEMTDAVNVRAYAILKTGEIVYARNSAGTAYQSIYTVSLAEYAKTQLGTSTPEYDDLLISMLNFGAAAQTRFEYKMEKLANASLTEDQKIVPDAVLDYNDILSRCGSIKDNSATVSDPNNTRIREASIVFADVTYIKYYLTQAETKAIKNMTLLSWDEEMYNAAMNGEQRGAFIGTETSASLCNLEADGRYSGKTYGIYPADLRNTVYARGYIEYEDGSFGYTNVYKFTAEYNAYDFINRDVNAYLYHALMNYSDAAAAYFAS